MTYALPFAEGSRVIELGGGSVPMYRPNVDARYCVDDRGQQVVDFTADFEQSLPILSSEWDGVFSKFAIEHISWRKISGFIAEVHRILRPGGIAVVITANAEAQMRWSLRQDWDEKVSQCLGGDQEYSDNTHKVFFNPAWIARLFRVAGFASVIVLPFGALKTDMIVEARKPKDPA